MATDDGGSGEPGYDQLAIVTQPSRKQLSQTYNQSHSEIRSTLQSEDAYFKNNHNNEKLPPHKSSMNWPWFCCFWNEKPDTSSTHKSKAEKGSLEEKSIQPPGKTFQEFESDSDLHHPKSNHRITATVPPSTFEPPAPLCIPQVSVDDEPPKLHNFGNTCFFNAALQGIFSTSEFHALYVRPYNEMRITAAESTVNEDVYTKVYEVPSKTDDDPLHLSITSKPGPLTKAFNVLLQNIHGTSFISPGELFMELGKRNSHLTTGRQQDSHEVLKCIFDALKDEEIQPVKKHIEDMGTKLNDEEKMKYKGYLRMTSRIQTAIGQIIEGKIISVTICHECHDVSENVESFFDISLPIPEDSLLKRDYCSTRNVYAMREELNRYNPLCTVSDDSEVTMECHSPYAYSGLSMTSDTISPPYTERQRSYNVQATQPYMVLSAVTDRQHFTFKNPSVSRTGSGSVHDYYQLQGYEDSVTGQRETYLERQRQYQQAQSYKNYLVTHNEDHFQEYLKEKGLNHQLKSKRKQVNADNLQFCLSMFTDLDVLDEHNKFICKVCSMQNQLKSVDNTPPLCRVSKQIMIHQLPPVLILHMKRFEINHNEVFKDNRHISFSEVLDMAPYCTSKCIAVLGDANNRILYGLYAVVVHQGTSLRSGHYIAYVKRRPTKEKTPDIAEHGRYDEHYCSKGQWYFTSDTYVRKCTVEEVQESQAYMLFYERIPFIPELHATMI